MKHLRIVVASAWVGCLAPSPAPAQPVITGQPANQFIGPGATANFVPSATGAPPITYQWLLNGTAMAGATNRTLSLTKPQPPQWGYYSFIASNASGSVTSHVAELKVFVSAPHSISHVQHEADGSVTLSFVGETTANMARYYDLYPVEISSNLLDWAPLATVERANAELDTLRLGDAYASQVG
jgi:hypothetical protein